MGKDAHDKDARRQWSDPPEENFDPLNGYGFGDDDANGYAKRVEEERRHDDEAYRVPLSFGEAINQLPIRQQLRLVILLRRGVRSIADAELLDRLAIGIGLIGT